MLISKSCLLQDKKDRSMWSIVPLCTDSIGSGKYLAPFFKYMLLHMKATASITLSHAAMSVLFVSCSWNNVKFSKQVYSSSETSQPSSSHFLPFPIASSINVLPFSLLIKFFAFSAIKKHSLRLRFSSSILPCYIHFVKLSWYCTDFQFLGMPKSIIKYIYVLVLNTIRYW